MHVVLHAYAVAAAVATANINIEKGLSIHAASARRTLFEDDSPALVLLQGSAVVRHSGGLATDSMHFAPDNSQAQRPALWSGMDLADRASQTFLKGSVEVVDALPTQIMGHYNSGTNLLEALLKANFPDEFTIVDSSIFTPLDAVTNIHSVDDYTTVVGSCSFWKHSSLSILRDSNASVFNTCKGRVIGLAIVRNPLSWLVSFRQTAYDLYSCNWGEDWLTRKCVYPSFAPSYLGGKSFDNVADIWNTWTRDYNALADFGFDRRLLIRYEDLVLNTEDVLRRISEVANLNAPDKVAQIEENMSPTHDENDERTKAIEAIKLKSYLDDLSADEMIQACSRLSAELMSQHGYDDCRGIS